MMRHKETSYTVVSVLLCAQRDGRKQRSRGAVQTAHVWRSQMTARWAELASDLHGQASKSRNDLQNETANLRICPEDKKMWRFITSWPLEIEYRIHYWFFKWDPCWVSSLWDQPLCSCLNKHFNDTDMMLIKLKSVVISDTALLGSQASIILICSSEDKEPFFHDILIFVVDLSCCALSFFMASLLTKKESCILFQVLWHLLHHKLSLYWCLKPFVIKGFMEIR